MGIFDKIGEVIFDAQWYIFEERQIRRSMKRFNKDMDRAINSLNRAIEKYPDTTLEKHEQIKNTQDVDSDLDENFTREEILQWNNPLLF